EFTGKDKWLFNSEVLNSFEGGYNELKTVHIPYRNLFKLALINAAMENCNAKKDGKCLRYRNNWQQLKFNKESMLKAFEENISKIIEDLISSRVKTQPKLFNSDSRNFLINNRLDYKLCI